MVPVITEGIPLSASRLPVLNNNGYMLVTSDIVEPNDIVKAGSLFQKVIYKMLIIFKIEMYYHTLLAIHKLLNK